MVKMILYFLAIFAYIVGTIGGFGYAMYCKAYFIGICVLVLGVMAFPTAKSFFKKLTE